MIYGSVTRTKIIVWTIVMAIILVGSSVFAAWDKGIVVKTKQAEQQGNPEKGKETSKDKNVKAIELISGATTSGSVASGVMNSGDATQDLVYLNDWQYVDMQQVRDTWLQWTNYLRTQQLGGRKAYVADWRLNMTAQAWSDYSASIGSISHKRKASDGYYNYNGLVQWFKSKGEELTGSPIIFANVSHATFSESIGRGMRSCGEADCTDEVIEATRSTWNFFYKERSYNGVHYRALTHKNFAIQGLGLAFSGKKYFLTIHYGTQIIE